MTRRERTRVNGATINVDAPLGLGRAEQKKKAGRGRWRMRDGTIIRIRDMDDQHLHNSIAYIERLSHQYFMSLGFSAGHYAATTGGEMAADAANEAADDAFERAHEHEIAPEVEPKYSELIAERDRRGLEARPFGKAIRKPKPEADFFRAHPEEAQPSTEIPQDQRRRL